MNFLQQAIDQPALLKSEVRVLESGVRLETLNTGVLQVRPPADCEANYRVVISSGIHGNETAPMEIVDGLVNDIASGRLQVANELLFIIGNPPAVVAENRFVEENLNRLFDGKHQNKTSKEAYRAALLESTVQDFYTEGSETRLHYDLHTAIRGSMIEKFAVHPFLHGNKPSASQLGFLENCGIEAVLFSNQPSGTFSYFTSRRFDANAFTVELGKVRKFGENDMADFADIDAGLRRAISGNENFTMQPNRIKLFAVVEEVIKQTDAFKLHVGEDAMNFTEFKAGALLASDENYEYRTQRDGERFVFPISNVPCGQRAMLVIAPTTIEQI